MENAEKTGRRAPERVPLPGFLSIKWHVVFKMKAHRRPVPGCGSQRMLHTLEWRSHPADHGPSFASLYSPFCRYATSSPDRGKSFLERGSLFATNRQMHQSSPFGRAGASAPERVCFTARPEYTACNMQSAYTTSSSRGSHRGPTGLPRWGCSWPRRCA